jgi:hypothetical protein
VAELTAGGGTRAMGRGELDEFFEGKRVGR